MTLQQVPKYELGETRVIASRLLVIANTLRVPVSFFFANSQPDHQAASRLDRPETIELLRYYHSFADDRVRRQFLGLVKAVAARAKNAGPDGPSDQAIASSVADHSAVDADDADSRTQRNGTSRMTRRRKFEKSRIPP